jgi:hypothetical protein
VDISSEEHYCTGERREGSFEQAEFLRQRRVQNRSQGGRPLGSESVVI